MKKCLDILKKNHFQPRGFCPAKCNQVQRQNKATADTYAAWPGFGHPIPLVDPDLRGWMADDVSLETGLLGDGRE